LIKTEQCVPPGQGLAELLEARQQRGARINKAGRAVGGGNLRQRYVLGMEHAVTVGEMAHRAAVPPALLSSAAGVGAAGAACVAPAGAGRGGRVSEVLVPQAPRSSRASIVPKVRMMPAKIMMLAEGL